METTERKLVDSVETLEETLARVKEAQKKFATYTQEQVDKIFLAAAIAANQARIPLAKMAVEETGMGVVEDKVIKNNYAAEYIYNAYKNTKTCGVLKRIRHTASRRSQNRSVLSPPLFRQQTRRQRLFLSALSHSRPVTLSSSVPTREQSFRLSLPQSSFLKPLLKRAHPRRSSVGLTFRALI